MMITFIKVNLKIIYFAGRGFTHLKMDKDMKINLEIINFMDLEYYMINME